MDGRPYAAASLRVRAFVLGAITLKLADSLTVNSVISEEIGRLLFLRVHQPELLRHQPADAGAARHRADAARQLPGPAGGPEHHDDSVAVAADQARSCALAATQPDELPLVPPEDNWLFSNRAQWYPQAQVTDYATAVLRITVPAEYAVVASGVQASGSPVVRRGPGAGSARARDVHVHRDRSRCGISAWWSAACSAWTRPPSRSTSSLRRKVVIVGTRMAALGPQLKAARNPAGRRAQHARADDGRESSGRKAAGGSAVEPSPRSCVFTRRSSATCRTTRSTWRWSRPTCRAGTRRGMWR